MAYRIDRIIYCNWESPSPLTPDNCGASQIACNIVNNTFLSLDGFEAMRKQMAGTDYTAEHFGAELARVTDRETSGLLSALQEAEKYIGALPKPNVRKNFRELNHLEQTLKAVRIAISKATGKELGNAGCDNCGTYDRVDGSKLCSYCGGSCPSDEEHACDGYLGDIDGLDSERDATPKMDIMDDYPAKRYYTDEMPPPLSDQLRAAGFPRLASNLDLVGNSYDIEPSDADPGL